jgi:hypothetical protein
MVFDTTNGTLLRLGLVLALSAATAALIGCRSEQRTAAPVFSPSDKGEWARLSDQEKDLLAGVKDHTRKYDEEAFYWLTGKVGKVDVGLMKPGNDIHPYADLFRQPADYRGVPITLRGIFLMAVPFSVTNQELKKEVTVLYECTIREEPIQEVRPIATVVLFERPAASLKAGQPILVKGYFYKIREYEGTKGIGQAPLLIARCLELAPPAASSSGLGTSVSEESR